MTTTSVGIGPISEADLVAVARDGAPIELTAQSLAAIAHSRAVVEALADDVEPHYGISTGFGALATKHIPPDRRAQLQRGLIRSHAAGSGPEVEREVIRAMMLLRLSTLATGRTGVQVRTAETLAGLLNAQLTPLVREYGSLGCSGDLAPLAHVALALIGEGDVRDRDGQLRPAAEAMAAAGIEPITLAEKEGLALINGTDGMLGQLLLACTDFELLLRTADLTAAMSVEAMLGTVRVFAEDLQALRPQPGQAVAAANLRALLAGSPIVASHAGPDCTYVQDAYSMRCAPQVAGAGRDTLAHARLVAGYELASAVDNPVVTLDGRVESNGNFHGAPVAYVLDFLAIPVADLASMSERRTDRLLDVARSRGLPPFLADDAGVDSGHMIAQYTQAAIVSELKRLAMPASVDSIPSSAMQEDHVSMGWSAARKLRRSIDGLRRVLAIELLSAARALDLRAPLQPGPAIGAVLAALREQVPGPGPDRYLSPEIEVTVRIPPNRCGRGRRQLSPGHPAGLTHSALTQLVLEGGGAEGLGAQRVQLAAELVHPVPVDGRAAPDQPVGQHPVSALGQHRLGMELHPVDRQAAMPDRHHHPGRGPAGHLDLIRQRFGTHRQRVVSGRGERHRQAGQHPAAGMLYLAGLAVQQLRRPIDHPAEHRADRLVAKAHPEQRYPQPGRLADHCHAHAGLFRNPRSGRDQHPGHLEAGQLSGGHRIVAPDHHLGAELGQVLHQVVDEAVVVVDDQDLATAGHCPTVPGPVSGLAGSRGSMNGKTTNSSSALIMAASSSACSTRRPVLPGR